MFYFLNDDKNTEVGSPNIAGASVEAKLLENVKDRTIQFFTKEEGNIQEKKMDIDKDILKYK